MDTEEVIISGIQVKKFVEHKSAAILEKYHVRSVELDILVFLYLKGCDTRTDIMREKHLSKAHVSKSIDNLKNRGFVLLDEDNEDHRIEHIKLTKQALDIMQEVVETYDECRRILFNHITKEEESILKRVLEQMISNLNEALS